MKRDVLGKVLHTIKRLDMVKKGEKVLLAVSGGPDSMFLFHAFHNLKDRLGIELLVANIDHGIRGKASVRDSQFVMRIARSFGIPCMSLRVDRATYRENNKLSQEEIARKVRYDFLISSARRRGASVIATGHTLDDHAETIVMRIVRGTALRGVVGIPPVRRTRNSRIIRPLIEVTKEEVVDFLKRHTIPYRVDHTNLQDDYFRNRIRNRLLPYLMRYNPRIKYALVNLAENLREDFEFITEEKRRKRLLPVSGRSQRSLKLKDIIIQPTALRKEIMRDALAEAGANIKKVSYKHWKDVDNFIRLKQKGKSIDLPGGIRIRKEENALVFFKIRR
jgi:tRNA(Ile)-lysidine synthase